VSADFWSNGTAGFAAAFACSRGGPYIVGTDRISRSALANARSEKISRVQLSRNGAAVLFELL